MDIVHLGQDPVVGRFHSPDYQLLEKIGAGGFGQVYKAIQHSTQKLVAIKFLTLLSDASPEKNRRHIARFHRESDLICRLNHPNIVQLLDKGQQGDSVIYAVYEFIDGHTLKAHLEAHGPLSAIDAAEIMACVLDALSHAHEQGVIHRDIKPANIMLYKVGAKTHVKVLDFGIGTLQHDVRQLDYKSITLTQETLGTPTYSAPEQLRGEPPVAQTDIYVWGLVFLECLSGVPTFTGGSLAAIFHQQLSASNVPLGLLAGHRSAHLFRRVLSKKAHERPADTAKLYHEFCQLNFANLVGALSEQEHHHRGSVETQIVNNADTLIHAGRFSYSRLTERKPISVLSVILGAQSCSSAHPVEQEIIDTFHHDLMQQCIDIAIRYGANHVGGLGDNLLFYFGHPNVSENDSRLCSRTALDIVSNFNNKNKLLQHSHGIVSQVQMGIDIGYMVSVANALPEGHTAHQAMTLCRKAQPGQILCSDRAKQRLESHVNFDFLPARESHHEGTLEPHCYQLSSERQSEAFGFLRGTRKHRGFIGREQELTQLIAVLTSPCTAAADARVLGPVVPGQGHLLAHVYGEAGIGKSRCVLELKERLVSRRYFVAQCLPEHQNNALSPILTLLKHQHGLMGMSDERCRAHLMVMIAKTSLSESHQRQGLLVLAAWLNLPLSDDYLLSELSPERQKRCLFAVISALLCHVEVVGDTATSERDQYLFIFEDMHWADPVSCEFIRYLVSTEVFTQGRHAWLNTSREPLPLTMSAFIPVAINRLSRSQSYALIDELFDRQRLAAGLTALLIERTDGIPLFIEELITSLQQQKSVHKVNGIIDFVDHDTHPVPATLRELLQQRLDGLRFAKETAQLAATIGRAFDYTLLIAVSGKGEAQVQQDLQALINAELVYLQRQVDGDRYFFKHALVRDAAYDGMERPARQQVHLQLARILVDDFADRVARHPAETARHYAGAGECGAASTYYALAGDHAVTIASHREAVTFYQAALVQLDTADGEYLLEKMELNTQLANVLTMKSGYASEQVEQIQHTLAELKARQAEDHVGEAREMTDTLRRQAATDCWGQSVFQMVSGNFEQALALTTVYRAHCVPGDHLAQICPHLSEAFIALWQGQLSTAYGLLQQTAQFNTLARHGLGENFQADCTALYGYNTQVAAGIYTALNHYVLTNNAPESGAFAQDALMLARQASHPYTLVHCLCRAALIDIIMADLPSAYQKANEAQFLAAQCDIALWHAVAKILSGYCAVVLEQKPQGLSDMKQSIAAYLDTGAITNVAIYQTLYADALRVCGEEGASIAMCDQVIAACATSKDVFYLSETYRVKAAALQGTESDSAGDRDLNQALAIATEQQALGFIHRINNTRSAMA
ncbi:TOMM system kinase/cyclase fusion protein [Shewanella sp. YLB-07]|uniref:TOMM system kinase/cyclase fusion protein n=1 Tax=Shewanella sp. YLB-07 TaxID=2601268 RepID=UPI00128D7D86|nr:TOMM system kinase/cyclase fusion protein [Shewanella sp. YLB-07]MPY26890.1 TOMM system kinase/cyclase fusion protein [Shewanella sp. YLB-07]